ncbi:MAG: ATP-binding protein, partial [Bacteroidota bacterium]
QKYLPYLPLLSQAQLNERLANIFHIYEDLEKARVFANQSVLEYQLLMEKNVDYKGNYQTMLSLRDELSDKIQERDNRMGEYKRQITFFEDLTLFILGLAAISTVLILWYSRRRIKHKNQALLDTNEKIQFQHQEITRQRDELSQSSARLEELLEELQSQKEVLADSYAQLENQQTLIQEKNAALVASEEELRQQSEELAAQRDKLAESNRILEVQAQELESQKTQIQKQLKRRSKWNRMMKFAIQEKNQQQKKLREKNQKLESLQATKDLLISAVNHDLRNPLNALKNFSKKDYGGHPDELLHLIHRKSIRMEALIEDIINVYRADRLKLKIEMNSPYQAIAEAIREIKDMLLGEELPHIENQASPQMLALFDYRSIERVLENFLTNAIKYTDEEGSIIFRTQAIDCPVDADEDSQSQAKSLIRISIEDTGIGIPPEKLKNIFEPFVNPNARSLGSAQSVGIGLTFCKTIVQAHQSQLNITSTFGKGTTFYFDLPQALPESASEDKGLD